MTNTRLGRSTAYWLLAGATLAAATPSFAAEGRKIEEVVITAERTESTVQDTAISITAFSEEFIEDFGLRNQEDLQNYTPATTIQPYDIAIRGIGRLFRTLGGDPGVATYLNGVYSEDFGIASTEGGLFDVERVEILRGPQGTRYGRNAVGGAVNFINTRPKNNFEGEARLVGGTGGLFEMYGVINQPLIDDVLVARVAGTKRKRDGYINDTGPFESSINNYGDENYSLSLLFTPTDNLTFQIRGNERSYARKFNGGAGTSPIVTSENGGPTRDTTTYAFGYTQVSASATGSCAGQTLAAGQFCFNQFSGPGFKIGRRTQAGVDVGTIGGFGGDLLPNYSLGATPRRLSQPQDLDDLTGDSLEVSTGGNYKEFFDHQAVALNATWEVSDSITLRYNGGYTDYFYDRDTDEDKGSNLRFGSSDFYVLQSNENWQHEILLEMDFGDNLTITTGAFIYDAHINQTLDLYDRTDVEGRLRNPANYAGQSAAVLLGMQLALPGAGVVTNSNIDIDSSEIIARAGSPVLANGTVTQFAPWFGDAGDGLPGARHAGVSTPGTFFSWDNLQETRATALYFQGEWRFADAWALTVGARYAKDEKKAIERIQGYGEFSFLNSIYSGTDVNIPGGASAASIFGVIPVAVTPACNPATNAALAAGVNRVLSGLACFNYATGALNNQLNPTGTAPVRLVGTPYELSSYLPLEKDWDKFTGRVNIDFEPNDYSLVYFSITSGWRSGGYNLGFRSVNNPIYKPENVYSFELGYKTQLLDNTLQLNMSAYYYHYTDIQQLVNVITPLGAGGAVTNAPEARTIGFEGEVLWVPTDNWTLGGNWSYTKAEFTKSFITYDNEDPAHPQSLFSQVERNFDTDGNSLTLIPEYKFAAFSTYSFPLDENGRIDWLVSVAWQDEAFFSITNSDFDTAPDLWRVDTRVTWTSNDEAVTATVGVNNVLDELGARDQQRLGEADNYVRAITPNDPRLIYAELRYKFGE